MKIIYEADDGKQFEDENECESYEELQKHIHILEIDFRNKSGDLYKINPQDVFLDKVYQEAEQVYIYNRQQFNDFNWLQDYCGWWEFQQINEPGIWIRRSGEEPWDDGIWVNIKDEK